MDTSFQVIKDLQASLTASELEALYSVFDQGPEQGIQAVIELANSKGVTLSSEAVRGYVAQLTADHENIDLELDTTTLAAVSGGSSKSRGGKGDQRNIPYRRRDVSLGVRG